MTEEELFDSMKQYANLLPKRVGQHYTWVQNCNSFDDLVRNIKAPGFCRMYVTDVLQTRCEVLEPIIALNRQHAYQYAAKFIDPDTAYQWAKNHRSTQNHDK